MYFPLYFVWEKFIGVHETKSLFKRALARLPVVIPIWFLAIIFPFFGPINSTVGSLLVSFTVYIIPALAHMVTFASAPAREVIRPCTLLATTAYFLNLYIHICCTFQCFTWCFLFTSTYVHSIDTFSFSLILSFYHIISLITSRFLSLSLSLYRLP